MYPTCSQVGACCWHILTNFQSMIPWISCYNLIFQMARNLVHVMIWWVYKAYIPTTLKTQHLNRISEGKFPCKFQCCDPWTYDITSFYPTCALKSANLGCNCYRWSTIFIHTQYIHVLYWEVQFTFILRWSQGVVMIKFWSQIWDC